jgi:hypothetical protein
LHITQNRISFLRRPINKFNDLQSGGKRKEKK